MVLRIPLTSNPNRGIVLAFIFKFHRDGFVLCDYIIGADGDRFN